MTGIKQSHDHEISSGNLYADVCRIIESTRLKVAVSVNVETCMMNWLIGVRLKNDVLQNERAEYGKRVVAGLAEKLTDRYGKGWSHKKLLHCLRVAETFSENQIVSALQRKLFRIKPHK